MKTGIRVSCIIFYVITNLSGFGQMKSTLDAIEENKLFSYFVEPLCYVTNDYNKLNWIESFSISIRENDNIECKVLFKHHDKSEYLTFKIDSVRRENSNMIGYVSYFVLDDANNQAYVDNQANGIFRFQENEGLEILDIYFNIHNSTNHSVICWEAPNLLAGKTYKALVRESCKKTLYGGEMIYTYCTLKFENDSVFVTEYSTDIAKESTISKRKFSWEIRENYLFFDTPFEYGLLEIQNKRLIGKQDPENVYSKTIVFEEIAE